MNEELYNILKEKGINLPSNLDSFNQMIEEWEQEGIVESIDTETLKLLKEF